MIQRKIVILYTKIRSHSQAHTVVCQKTKQELKYEVE